MRFIGSVLLLMFCYMPASIQACTFTHADNIPFDAMITKGTVQIVGMHRIPKRKLTSENMQEKGFYVTWNENEGWSKPLYFHSVLVAVALWDKQTWLLSHDGKLLLVNRKGELETKLEVDLTGRDLIALSDSLVVALSQGNYLRFDGRSVVESGQLPSTITNMFEYNTDRYAVDYKGLYKLENGEWQRKLQWPITDHVRLAINSQGQMVAADRKNIYLIENEQIVNQSELHSSALKATGRTESKIISDGEKFIISTNCNEFMIYDGNGSWIRNEISGISAIGQLLKSNSENSYFAIARVSTTRIIGEINKNYSTFTLLESKDLKSWSNIGHPPMPVY